MSDAHRSAGDCHIQDDLVVAIQLVRVGELLALLDLRLGKDLKSYSPFGNYEKEEKEEEDEQKQPKKISSSSTPLHLQMQEREREMAVKEGMALFSLQCLFSLGFFQKAPEVCVYSKVLTISK